MAITEMSFCPKIPKLKSQNSLNWDVPNLRAHNFVCKPPIEVRYRKTFLTCPQAP